MKLFGFLTRAHKPDIDALSALVDGALRAAEMQELEAHVAGCAVCSAELDGLRRVKSMLAALPQAEPSRSFRLRLADVEAPAPRSPAPATGLLRAMPALAAVAAFVFVAVLATDLSTRDGRGDSQDTARIASGGASESMAMDRAAADETYEDATIANDRGAFLNELPGTPVADAPGGAVAPLPTVASDPPTSDFFAGESDGAGRDGSEAATEPDKQMGELEAAHAQTSDDDGDNRTAFLAAEIIAALIAVGAAAAFVASRWNRSEGRV
jgi:putative zinc finger protein